MEALAVVEEAASPLLTSDWNMPSIQGTQGMWTRPATNPLEVRDTASPDLHRPW